MEDKFEKKRKEKTWTSFLYATFGVTLPFFLSFTGLIIISELEFLIDFIDDGQILLFSAGLLTSAFYIFRDDDNQKSIKKFYDKLISHLILVILIFSSVIYAILYIVEILEPTMQVNVWFVRISSILIFIFAAYASFRSINIDHLKLYPDVDVKKISARNVKDIMDKL